MRLDFNVLWLDDLPAYVAAQRVAISRRMADEGFEFRATQCDTLARFRDHIGSDVFTDEIDLVLVDWDLGADGGGQGAIREVRQYAPHKDVIFYSAQTRPPELRQLVFNEGVEGVFCVTRQELVDEVMGVFEILVRKVLDLDHSRGIVMGATSDIDEMVRQCLLIMSNRLAAAGGPDLVARALDRIRARQEGAATTIETLNDGATMSEILEEHSVFTAYDRLRVLSHALSMNEFEAYANVRRSVVEYMNDVIPERNRLGHQVLSPDDRAGEVVDDAGNTMDLDELRRLRRRILGVRGDFRALLTALQDG